MTHTPQISSSPARPNRRDIVTTLALASSAMAVSAPGLTQDRRFEGPWIGVVRSGSIVLRVRLVIGPGETATLVSLDEGDPPRAASSVSFRGDEIIVQFRGIFASFQGRLSNGRLDGRWRQLHNNLPLVLEREGPASPISATEEMPALTLQRLSSIRREAEIPALGAAWGQAGARPTVLVDGRRSTRADAPVSPEDPWHLGSIAKSMTATVVARFVEAGALSWDDRVGDVLGRDAPDMRAEYRDATMADLLGHRAGFQADISDHDMAPFFRDSGSDRMAERLAYARLALRQRPMGRPGQDFNYSNNGYVVAAAMLESRTGASWEDAIKRTLFEPLGLSSAGFGAPGAPGRLDAPRGHVEPDWNWEDGRPRRPIEFGGRQPMDNPRAMGPAGGVHMNLPDLLEYLSAHCQRSGRLLSPAGWRLLHTPASGGNYALGWTVRPDGSLWHNGSNTYWYAEASVHPSEGVVAAVVANDGVADVTFPVVGRTLLEATNTARLTPDGS